MTIDFAITVAASPTAASTSTASGADAAIAWGGAALCLLVAAGLLLIVRRRLNGQHRRWVVAPPIPFQVSHRNTWPFMLIGFAGFWVMMAVATVFEALGHEDGRQVVWTWPAYIPLAFVILSVFTWPVALTPGWYQRWARDPAAPDVSPWPLEEAAEALADAPDHRARQKLVGDIGWSGQDPERAWELSGLPGRAPKSRFDERTQELQRELAQRSD